MFLSNGNSCIQEFFLRWDFTFPVRRVIKLPISARGWHVLVALLSKNQVYVFMYLQFFWKRAELFLQYIELVIQYIFRLF